MSKNIIIQEGGIGKQLTVDKLKTNLVGGGNCLWVPEDGTHLGTKYISEDGTYKASDDGYYGYSEVTVSGVGEVTGKAPDGSGDDATATVDPETGEIVVQKLPYSIAVTTNPSKTSYVDGETINTSGMVVKGYLKNGSLWTDSAHPNGIIPNSELTIDPTVAKVADTQTKELDGETVSYVGQRGLTQPFYGTPVGTLRYTSDGRAVRMYWGKTLFSTFSSYLYEVIPSDTSKEPIYGEGAYISSVVVDGGQRVYYSQSGSIEQELPYTDVSPVQKVANILFGVNSRSVGGDMQVAVSWNRSDGKTLETSFTVEVHDRLDSGE